MIVLERFDSMVANEISKKIKVIVEKYSLYGAPCVVVLHPTDYNLFLRHYTEGLGETVMYFVPRESNL